MKRIDPVTRLDLHMIALYSPVKLTPEMENFIITLPVDLKAASEDEIEAFDKLLNEMEENAAHEKKI